MLYMKLQQKKIFKNSQNKILEIGYVSVAVISLIPSEKKILIERESKIGELERGRI